MDPSPPEDGKLHLVENEDISDLRELYSDLPSDEEGIRQACQALRADLERSRTKRVEMFQQLVTLEAEAGTGGRMAQYRRLLSAGCGGMPLGDIDDALGALLEVSALTFFQQKHFR